MPKSLENAKIFCTFAVGMHAVKNTLATLTLVTL